MRQLRDIEIQPPKFSQGDRVLVEQWTIGSFHQKQWDKEQFTGTITQVGVSGYNIAYDWYIIGLDDGRVIESWWMTQWHIIKKLESVEPSGLPSQEA